LVQVVGNVCLLEKAGGQHAGPLKERTAMRTLIARFIRDEQGMETVEWAVVAALIVAGLVAVISGLGTNVNSKFNALKNATT